MNITRERKQLKTFNAVIVKNSINEANYTAEFVLSTNEIDRHGDIVDQSSWKLDNFLKAPRLLLQHEHNDFPIGIWEELWVEKDGDVERLVGRAKFAVEEYEKAKTTWNLVKGGFLNTISVGFIWGRAEYDEEREVVVYYDNELLEASIVSVPANPNAIMKNLNDESESDIIVNKIEESIKEIDEEIVEAQNKDLKANKKLKAKHYLLKALRNLK